MLGYRIIIALCLFFTSTSLADVKSWLKEKKYKQVIRHYEKKEGVKTFRDYVYFLLAHKSQKEDRRYIALLEEASKKFPQKDVLKRELSQAYEDLSNSYPNVKKFDLLKKQNLIKAVEILTELKEKKPTPQNLTAFVNFYLRQKDYGEALALLQIFSEKSKKGKNFYKLLCETQYKAAFFQEALSSCGQIKHPLASLYKFKSLKELGREEEGYQELVKLGGRFPASSEVQFELGKALIKKGFTLKGLEHLETHIEAKPSDEALVLKASSMFKLKKFDEALGVYIQACKQHLEPRKPLINKMKQDALTLTKGPLRDRYFTEVRKCRYKYKPKKLARR